MKRYSLFLLIIFGLFLGSCIDDKGNKGFVAVDELMPDDVISFSYKGKDMEGNDVEQISTVNANGFATDVINIFPGEFSLVPNFVENANRDKYDYRWTIRPRTNVGILEDAPIISEAMEVASLPESVNFGEYRLSLDVIDKETEAYKRFSVPADYAPTSLGRGMYLLKYIEGEGDVDYIPIDAEDQKEMQPNILVHNRLPEKPRAIAVLDKGWGHINTVTGRPDPAYNTIWVISPNHSKLFNLATLELAADDQEIFYDDKPEVDYTGFIKNGMAFGLMTKGQPNVQVSMMGVIDKLGYSTSPRRNFSHWFAGTNDIYLWDEDEKSFLKWNVFMGTFSSFPYVAAGQPIIADDGTEKFNTTKMDGDIKLFKRRSFSRFNVRYMGNYGEAVAIFGKNDGTNHILFFSHTGYSNKYPIARQVIIPEGNPVLKAKDLYPPVSGYFTYYTEDNKVFAYIPQIYDEGELIQDARNVKVAELPAGHTIADVVPYTYDGKFVVAIVSNSGSNWHIAEYLRLSEQGHQLETEPVRQFTGEGEAIELNLY